MPEVFATWILVLTLSLIWTSHLMSMNLLPHLKKEKLLWLVWLNGLERCPIDWIFAGWITSQVTHPGCGFDSHQTAQKTTNGCFSLSLSLCLSPSPFLSLKAKCVCWGVGEAREADTARQYLRFLPALKSNVFRDSSKSEMDLLHRFIQVQNLK